MATSSSAYSLVNKNGNENASRLLMALVCTKRRRLVRDVTKDPVVVSLVDFYGDDG